MALLSTVLCLVLAGSGVARSPLLNPFLDAAHHQESLSRLESCFCQVPLLLLLLASARARGRGVDPSWCMQQTRELLVRVPQAA